MEFMEAKTLVDDVAKTLKAALTAENLPDPPGVPGVLDFQGQALRKPESLFPLVPNDLREKTLAGLMALSDEESLECLRKVADRNGLSKEEGSALMSYFSNPFWRDAFSKARRALPTQPAGPEPGSSST